MSDWGHFGVQRSVIYNGPYLSTRIMGQFWPRWRHLGMFKSANLTCVSLAFLSVHYWHCTDRVLKCIYILDGLTIRHMDRQWTLYEEDLSPDDGGRHKRVGDADGPDNKQQRLLQKTENELLIRLRTAPGLGVPQTGPACAHVTAAGPEGTDLVWRNVLIRPNAW